MHRDLRASLSGKDIPEDVKTRLLALHEENLNVKEQLKTTQDKLAKAKTVTLRLVEYPTSYSLLSVHKVSRQALQRRTGEACLHDSCKCTCRRFFPALLTVTIAKHLRRGRRQLPDSDQGP